MPYELLKDEQKKQIGMNNEAKMTLYNALPRNESDRVFMCKIAKEVKSLALNAKVTREHTSDDGDSQGTRFGHESQFGNDTNRFGRGCRNSFGNKGDESSKQKGVCYNCGLEGHFSSECRKLNENKAFVGGAWSDSEDGDVPQNDATCLMALKR
nr:retrovirus-related Pol polyprotein from transposon TNT 1-94 [Tanacetum cinerariifolium]